MNRAVEWALAATLAGAVCALGATPALAWSAAGAAVTALFAAVLFAGALRDREFAGFLLWPAAVLGYAALSLWYGAAPARSVFFLAQWGAYFAAALTAFYCLRSGGGRVLARTLVGLASAEALFGLVQYLTGYRYVLWYEKTRYLEDSTGTYINHNHFAGLMVLALGPALAAAAAHLRKGRWRGHVYLAASALMLLALIFSRSRMGIAAGFATLAGFGAYVAVKGRGRAAAWIVAALPLMVGLYAAWIGLGPVAGRFTQIAGPESEPRIVIWRDTWQLVKQRPWLGWGAGTFPAVYPTVRTEPSDLRWMEAHNDYLQVMCELGVAGLLLVFLPLFTLVYRLGRKALRAPGLEGRREAALAVSLGGILLHEVTDFHLYVPANALWIMTLAGAGYALVKGPARERDRSRLRERLPLARAALR